MRKLKEKYETLASIQMECTYNGNFKKGNRASDELIKINKFFLKNFEETKETIDELIISDNPNVILWISNVILEKNYRTEEVKSKIVNIAETEQFGIISFNAEMILKKFM